MPIANFHRLSQYRVVYSGAGLSALREMVVFAADGAQARVIVIRAVGTKDRYVVIHSHEKIGEETHKAAMHRTVYGK